MESKRFVGCYVSYALKKKTPKLLGQGWCGNHTLSSGIQEPSLLVSLCPHEKLSSSRSSHDPRWLLVLQPHYLHSRQEKSTDPANVPSQKNNQTTSSYISLATLATKQVGKCSFLYRCVSIHNKICSFTKEGA